MNITLGLWRLWVLLAVCWVGTVTVVKFDELTATQFGYYDPGYLIFYNPTQFPEQEIEKNEISYAEVMHLEAIAAIKCKNSINADEIKNNCSGIVRGIKVNAPLWQDRLIAAQWVFIPPLGLLLLGLGIGWVVKGFRSPA